MATRLCTSPGPGHLPTQTAARLTLLAPTHVRRLFVPTLFFQLAEDAFLGQLALESLNGLFDIIVLNLDLHAITTLYNEFHCKMINRFLYRGSGVNIA